MDYSFLPSYHIKNIRHLKEIKLEIEYNNFNANNKNLL